MSKHVIVCDVCRGCNVPDCEARCGWESGEAHSKFLLDVIKPMTAKQLKEWETELACRREAQGVSACG